MANIFGIERANWHFFTEREIFEVFGSIMARNIPIGKVANRAVNDGFLDSANPCPTDPRPNLSREFLASSRMAVIEAVMD